LLKSHTRRFRLSLMRKDMRRILGAAQRRTGRGPAAGDQSWIETIRGIPVGSAAQRRDLAAIRRMVHEASRRSHA
jgi:hypothetical protein